MARAFEEASYQAYQEAKVEQYRYLATLEARTCDHCGSLDLQVFDLKDKRDGVNYPPLHPFCRCTTVAYFGEELASRWSKDPLTGRRKWVDGSMSYEEWRGKMTSEQAGAVAAVKNRYADKKQYDRWRGYLGSDMPSFGDFQKMKYNQPQAYANLKTLARAGRRDVADEMAAPRYRAKYSQLELQKLSSFSFKTKQVTNAQGIKLSVSENLAHKGKAVNYYNRKINQVLKTFPKVEGAELPEFVLVDMKQDFGRANSYGLYDKSTNKLYLDASLTKNKAIIARLQAVNAEKNWFAVADSELSTITHELGHWYHRKTLEKVAKDRGISFEQANRELNTKIIALINQKGYNISESVSEYAKQSMADRKGEVSEINELIAEALSIELLGNTNGLTRNIKTILKGGDW